MSHNTATTHKTLLLLLIAAITAIFFRSQGTADINTWLTWGRHAYEHGVVDGYAMDGNLYPPFAEIFLWLSYCSAIWFGIAPVITLKISLLLFLLASTTIVYVWTNKNLLATLFFYAAMLLSSLGLGYLDIYFAPFILLALYKLHKNRLTQFAVLFMFACLVKFPPILVAPFFVIYVFVHNVRWQHKWMDLKKLCYNIVLPCFVLLLPVLFFFGKTLVMALLKTANAAWLSAWALNFNWIVTRIFLQNGWGEAYPDWFEATVAIMSPVPDSARLIARCLYLFFFLSSLVTFLLCKKTFENLLLYALLGSFAYFMFYTGVHENHLFLASLLAAALFCVNPKNMYLALGVLFISTMNMFMFYGVSGGKSGGFLFHADISATPYSYWTDAPLLLAIVNTIYFLVLWGATMATALNKKAPHERGF